MCVVCRNRYPKTELLRFISDPERGLVADPRQWMPGRGCYVCKTESCQDKLTSTRKRRKRCKGEMHGQ
ncbi:YlxR family protein [Desulfonatronum parangueonense]